MTYKSSFRESETGGASHLDGKQLDRVFPPSKSTSGGLSRGEGSRDQGGRLPGGPTCYYCKRKGHVMSECWSMERKEKNKPKPDLVVRKAEPIPPVYD